VYGQNPDLIVTTTNDSIHCKIIEVTPEQIRFSVRQGRIIPIKREEVASYKYNFTPIRHEEKIVPAITEPEKTTPIEPEKTTEAKPVETEKSTEIKPVEPEKSTEAKPAEPEKTIEIKPVETEKTAEIKPVQPQKEPEKKGKKQSLYFAFNFGANQYGSVSYGEIQNGYSTSLGIDAAFLIGGNVGVGIKWNTMGCDVNLSETFKFHDRVTFIGPALYGNFGKDKLKLTAGAGIGQLRWKMSDMNLDYDWIDDKPKTTMGGFISAGVNYMFLKNVGVGLNLQAPLGSFEERNPTGIGATLGIVVRNN